MARTQNIYGWPGLTNDAGGGRTLDATTQRWHGAVCRKRWENEFGTPTSWSPWFARFVGRIVRKVGPGCRDIHARQARNCLLENRRKLEQVIGDLPRLEPLRHNGPLRPDVVHHRERRPH